MRTVWVLAAAFTIATLGDAYTTWACLHAPVQGWEVLEANPLAEWIFGKLGLVPGLAVDTVLTLLVALWVTMTSRIPMFWKLFYLNALTVVTALAVYNNVQGMIRLGLI